MLCPILAFSGKRITDSCHEGCCAWWDKKEKKCGVFKFFGFLENLGDTFRALGVKLWKF